MSGEPSTVKGHRFTLPINELAGYHSVRCWARMAGPAHAGCSCGLAEAVAEVEVEAAADCQREVERLGNYADGLDARWEAAYAKQGEEVERLRAALRNAISALEAYGRHFAWCPVQIEREAKGPDLVVSNKGCTCGYYERLLALWKSAHELGLPGYSQAAALEATNRAVVPRGERP